MTEQNAKHFTPDWLRAVLGERIPTESPLLEKLSRPAEPGVEVLATTRENGEKGEPLWLREFSEEEVAKAVNDIRRIALEFGGSQQLRERLYCYLAPILKGEARP